jgi:hypothetical protein
MSSLMTTYLLRHLPRPRFLSGPAGTAFLRTFCQVADLVAQDALDARSEATVQTASSYALPPLARNRNDRSYRRESMAALAVYLLQILAQKAKAGTEDGLRAQFARIGCPDIEIVTELDLRNAGVMGGFGGNIGFFFIIVRQPHPFDAISELWDGGGQWNDGIAKWGSTLDDNDIAEIEDLLRRWKAAGTSCRFILFDEDGTTAWGPGGITGNYQEVAINEAWEHLPPDGIVTPYYNVTYLEP